MTGYDSKYIIRAAAHKSIVEDIEVIGPSSEKFNAIRVNKKLLFLDSYSFFHNSLDAMAKNMDKQSDYKLTRAFLNQYFDDKHIDMLLQKGIYPYEYFTSVSKYNETTLPPRECFFNQLTQSPISDKDYEWAQTVWTTFNLQNLRQYTELYVTVDTLILADVFQKMRGMFMNKFTLDPAHYYSVSQLSWDCFLKQTGIKLKYIKDPTLYLFLESSIRGGISTGKYKNQVTNIFLL